jgi:Tol biopolymer transport system component
MTVAASGGEPKEVFRTSSPEIFDPAWSRDGRDVLFVRAFGTAAHGGNEIYAIPTEGGEPRPFGLGPMHDIKSPAVHPDGKQMAFVDEAVNQQLWVLKNLFGEKKAAR